MIFLAIVCFIFGVLFTIISIDWIKQKKYLSSIGYALISGGFFLLGYGCHLRVTVDQFKTRQKIQYYEKKKDNVIVLYNDELHKYYDIETYNTISDSSYIEVTYDILRDGDTVLESYKLVTK